MSLVSKILVLLLVPSAVYAVARLAPVVSHERQPGGPEPDQPAEGKRLTVTVASVGRSSEGQPVVLLRAEGRNEVLPIFVGPTEAIAIAMEMAHLRPPRPMTHDLLKNLLLGLETRVHKVVVSDLRDDTFYALIWLERDGQVISIDSRPSDALALALRVDCPIYVEDEVLKNSKVSGAASDKVNNEELRKWLENLNDEDIGRYKM